LSWKLSLSLISIGFPFWLEFLSAIIGLLAVIIQLTLFFTDLNKKWLYARYMVEKTRLWKFQLFLDGKLISNSFQISIESFNEEIEKRWIIFQEKFQHGLGEMDEYVESHPTELMIKSSPYTNNELIIRIKEVYLLLRLDVQSTHFGNKNLKLESLDQLTDSWAKVLLCISGSLAILEACLFGIIAINLTTENSESLKTLTALLAGFSLSFAIISAAIRVYRSASAIAEERERYRSKQNYIKRIKDRIKDEVDSTKILSLMEEAEIICNEELQEFLISLKRADYFF
jgi:hypothetical protein